jgi:hypothetical protein
MFCAVAGLVGTAAYVSNLSSATGFDTFADAAITDVSARPETSTTPANPAAEAKNIANLVRYGRDIRPILSDRCFLCHGTDEETREAGLRLDQRDDAIAPRGEGSKRWHAIVPGNPDASELWRRIVSNDPNEVMPPAHANKRPLNEEERQLIRTWITQGATYEPHWAFVPPQKVAVPEVKDTAWPRDAIDHFVLANLEQHNVAPSPEADRPTLLRRLYLDLTGLPPTPEEVAAFETDLSLDAYEKRVDALFTTEPFRTRLAERLTAPWLDAARYADTNGIHMDAGRQMWLWRDWVIQAFRDNMPYDRFLTEQLAGDLLPDATIAQKIASGFNRNHVITDEGGAIGEEYLVEYAVDRVATTSDVFLGLTLGCARCHDHKYDPITQLDFYSMFAFFNSIEEPGLYSQLPDPTRAFEPFIEVRSKEHDEKLAALTAKIAALSERLNSPLPGEDEQRAAFTREVAVATQASWSVPEVVSAVSSEPVVKLTVQDDRSIQASGPIPNFEDYTCVLRTNERGQRLILVEMLPTPGGSAGAGRTSHGNFVLTGVTVEETRTGRETEGEGSRRSIPVRWAWADHAQQDRDYEAINVIHDDSIGWAADGGSSAGNRVLVLLTDEAFGATDETPTDVRVTLKFRSAFTQHTPGRLRFRFGTLSDAGLARLPLAFGRWYSAGHFAADRTKAYDTAFGPEQSPTLDLAATFGTDKKTWTFDAKLVDGKVVSLPEIPGATYLGRTIYSPDQRSLKLSLGSDDGFLVFLNGEKVAERRDDRGVAPDQDQVQITLRPGVNTLIFKIVNTGGISGYYFRATEEPQTLLGKLAGAVLPPESLNERQQRELTLSWRRQHSPDYAAAQTLFDAANKEQDEVLRSVPRTMVMKELPTPKPTFVLSRGQYDRPDPNRPAPRAVPKALGSLPDGAPQNRLGLAAWMTSDSNPLVARVAVNRFWEMLFGAGLVRTLEDFGFQGEWPSHPELLDTLAVDFRESGWDVHRLLRRIVLSSTYRQASRVRQDVAEHDPNNRWLSFYPRRRLAAEQVRDHALFVSGTLAEKLGGPSVKPYQPDGLWQEVAMLQSNTREYVMGSGDDLRRRSIYTYWKRAVPPPTLQTLDAPTRESCVVRRITTNTPLQALALWNDVQFVEAARDLAKRTLGDANLTDDTAKLKSIFIRVTSRAPDASDLATLTTALSSFRDRYSADPQAAAALVAVSQAPAPIEAAAEKQSKPELAAWTMIAASVLNLHESLTQD